MREYAGRTRRWPGGEMTHDIIVAALGGTSTCISGLYLRYIRKRDTAAEKLAQEIEANRECCREHANKFVIVELYLQRLADYGLPRYFDKD